MGEVDEVQREMQRRISRQNRTVMGWVGGFFVLLLLFGLARRLFHLAPANAGDDGRMTLFVLGGLALSFVPGLLGMFYNPRCPKCEGWIAWYLSQKLSLFGSFYPNECPKCGVQLFDPKRPPRLLGK